MLFQGEHIGTTEATETFFAMTKLFQCKDVSIDLYIFTAVVMLCTVVINSLIRL